MRNATTATTTRRASTRLAISVLIALAAMLSLVEVIPAQTTVDYDLDNDGYIDVSTHAQLNAIRHDLDGNGDATHADYVAAFPNRVTTTTGRMGCPSGTCTGYELLANIDLDTDGDGSIGTDSGDAYYNSGNGWDPIGTSATKYTGDFKGNGYTIDNLFISRSSTNQVGLFGEIGSGSNIETLGVTNANVTGNRVTGILAGHVQATNASVVACYTTGSVTGNSDSTGGLVGYVRGTVSTSYSTATVSGSTENGGLVGWVFGSSAAIRYSYATGAVSGSGSNIGGLIGGSSLSPTISASYYDNQTSGRTGGTGPQSTSNLQTPTGYTGIYSTWNANIDGVTGNDDPWDFGTSSQYPVLKYGGHSRVAQGRAAIDYDLDGDNYIEVSTHAQLNAVRYDLNGDGNPSDGPAEWRVAFPSAAADVGCAATCTGYELTGNIDIDTNGDGLHSSADAYWNSGNGWESIGTDNPRANNFQGDFKGNGYEVQNLFINRSTGTYQGLFGGISATSRIESLGVTDASVSASSYVGALTAASRGEIVACWSTGSVTSANETAGGLVGWTLSSITSSYSTASVTGEQHVGGLLGAAQGSVTVTNSYATGTITRETGSAHTTIGGLIGSGASASATASYWDTQTTGCASGGTAGCTTSAGGSGATGQTTSALQTPVGYTGIYSTWDVNLDGVTGNDDPWAFGTTSDYPTLKYGKATDYDEDNDGYIDITSHAQLNVVRHDLDGNGDPTAGAGATAYDAAFPDRDSSAGGRMGCPSGACTGYELLADINLDTDGDGSADSGDEYWHSGDGWLPIGTSSARYTGDFKGNGFVVDNLFISRSNTDYQGLFGATAGSTRIETLGVTNANITAKDYVGVLVGHINGDVVACYTTGAITAGSYVGGLAGYMGASGTTPSIHSSYSYASITANFNKGGLVGRLNLGSITNSYSTGSVPGSISLGGLVGIVTGFNAGSISVTGSYWDTQTSGVATSPRGTGQTTTALKTPTGYTGIYSDWNANIDGNAGNDNPWDFGTASQYPVLRYGGHSLIKQGRGDYDADNDGLIDIANLAQLNVIRHDIDGNGNPTAGAGATAYNAAFSGRDTRSGSLMGCPSGTCAGYELVASLDFDSDGDGDVDANDHGGAYWNSGTGWAPLGDDSSNAYATVFKGNGYTVNNLFINRTSNTSNLGLFASIANAGRIESLGVTNASINTGTAVGSYNGILAGNNYGEIVACYTTGSITSNNFVGGLTGFSSAGAGTTVTITSSYSTASVTALSTATNVGGLVGRVSQSGTGTSTIVNSYSTGAVNANAGGGLVGSNNNGSATASYWDTISSGRSSSALGTGKTPRELQTVIGYTDIYSAWNANLDGQSGNDDPWTFGNNMQYPMLDYQGMSAVPQGGQAMGIPDNWNAPVAGERLGVCLTPADFPNRGIVSGQTYYEAWAWERSTNGATWTPISGAGDGNNPPTYEYTPAAADVGNFIRAKVKMTDGAFATTRALGGRVVEVDNDGAVPGATAGAEVPFVKGHAAPQVGTQIAASEPLPDGAVDSRVGWQRCPNNDATYSDCVHIPHVWWIYYTPTADDVGNYLRMYVYYETSEGVWTRRSTPYTTAVVAAQ